MKQPSTPRFPVGGSRLRGWRRVSNEIDWLIYDCGTFIQRIFGSHR